MKKTIQTKLIKNVTNAIETIEKDSNDFKKYLKRLLKPYLNYKEMPELFFQTKGKSDFIQAQAAGC